MAIRAALPKIFADHKIRTVLDAPCGDFNWMKEVIADADVSYIGGDIVQPLIDLNNERYQSDRASFLKIDITEDALPKADLMICRDCLFHLSYSDIAKFFENFLSCEIPLLMTTTNTANEAAQVQNADIMTGDMRPIDLFTLPFGALQTNVLYSVDDHMVSRKSKRTMLLLPKSEVARMLENLKRR